MKPEVLSELYRPFKLKSRQGLGGKTFQYVPSEDIIHRMNVVFGGNWSTEVTLEKIVDEQVLMCVRVTVAVLSEDSDYDHYFSQEGYASHPIARYTQGNNSGKIIDIGNVYRSAMSKAIKTACAKWGVGLYLDGSNRLLLDGTRGEERKPEITPTPSVTTDVPAEIPIAGGMDNSMPFPNIPTETPTTATPPTAAPAVTAPVVTESQPTTFDAPPVFTNENVVTNASTDLQPPKAGVEMITPVQKVAIETSMGFNNIAYTELVSMALERSDDLPDIDHLTYDEAVKLIQCSNRLKAKK